MTETRKLTTIKALKEFFKLPSVASNYGYEDREVSTLEMKGMSSACAALGAEWEPSNAPIAAK